MKANRIAQLAIAAGIALTASVPAFSAPASSVQETTQASTTAPADKAAGESRHRGDAKPGDMRHHHGDKKHGEHRHHRGQKHDGMMLHGIDLTDEQKTKVGELRKAAQPQLREAMQQAFEARKELHQLSLSGKFDEAKAQALAEKGADAMARASVLKAKTDSQVFALLTPEQRKELADRTERMKERMKERQENRAERKAGQPATAPGAQAPAASTAPAAPAAQ